MSGEPRHGQHVATPLFLGLNVGIKMQRAHRRIIAAKGLDELIFDRDYLFFTGVIYTRDFLKCALCRASLMCLCFILTFYYDIKMSYKKN